MLKCLSMVYQKTGVSGVIKGSFALPPIPSLPSEPGEGTDLQLALAKKYNRDEKAANSHNYANGMMVAQVATEVIKRAKSKGKEITKETLYEELLGMNGDNAFSPKTTVGDVTFSETDHAGVDTLQLYVVKDKTFMSEGSPFVPEYTDKIK